jgi:hypothetical protein
MFDLIDNEDRFAGAIAALAFAFLSVAAGVFPLV